MRFRVALKVPGHFCIGLSAFVSSDLGARLLRVGSLLVSENRLNPLAG